MNILDQDVLTVLNLSIDGIFIENTRGDILVCNQAGAEMFGYTIEEITKRNVRDLAPPSESYYLKDRYTESDLFPKEYISRLNMKKDGTIFRTEINSKIITSNGQEYLISFVRDATKPAHTDPNHPNSKLSVALINERLQKEEEIQLTLHDSVGRKRFTIPVKIIEYIESCLKKVNVRLINGNILEGYDTLNRLSLEIPMEGSFLRCHQSYIVNMHKAELDEHFRVFVMNSGMRIPIRKKEYTKMKQAYYNYKFLLLQSENNKSS